MSDYLPAPVQQTEPAPPLDQLVDIARRLYRLLVLTGTPPPGLADDLSRGETWAVVDSMGVVTTALYLETNLFLVNDTNGEMSATPLDPLAWGDVAGSAILRARSILPRLLHDWGINGEPGTARSFSTNDQLAIVPEAQRLALTWCLTRINQALQAMAAEEARTQIGRGPRLAILDDGGGEAADHWIVGRRCDLNVATGATPTDRDWLERCAEGKCRDPDDRLVMEIRERDSKGKAILIGIHMNNPARHRGVMANLAAVMEGKSRPR